MASLTLRPSFSRTPSASALSLASTRARIVSVFAMMHFLGPIVLRAANLRTDLGRVLETYRFVAVSQPGTFHVSYRNRLYVVSSLAGVDRSRSPLTGNLSLTSRRLPRHGGRGACLRAGCRSPCRGR